MLEFESESKSPELPITTVGVEIEVVRVPDSGVGVGIEVARTLGEVNSATGVIMVEFERNLGA